MPITKEMISALTEYRNRFTELLGAVSGGPAILQFIMSPTTPATRRDIHAELARLEQTYLVTVPKLVETLSHKLTGSLTDLVGGIVPLTHEQAKAVATTWQQSVEHAKVAIYKLRYMFEIGGPLADWRAISRELDASASPYRDFSRNLDTWLRNVHLGRHPDGTPANMPGGVDKKPAPAPEFRDLTSDQRKQLKEEIERRRHLPFAEQLRLTMQDYEAMSTLFKKQHPEEAKAQKKREDEELPADEYETDDEGNIKEDRWGRPLKKVRIPTTPEEFLKQEREGDQKFENSQQKWVRKIITGLDTMSKSLRLNHLLETDEPFGIFLGSIVATKYQFGSLALKEIHKAKQVIGKTRGGYLVMRNIPVLGVIHQDDPQIALKFLQESTSRVLDKQRRWARFWFICSPPYYKGGHDYYLLWPKSLADDIHKGHFTQWDFNMQDQSNADAGTQT